MANFLFKVTVEENQIFAEKHPIQFKLGWLFLFSGVFVALMSMWKFEFGLETGIICILVGVSFVMYDRYILSTCIKDMKNGVYDEIQTN